MKTLLVAYMVVYAIVFGVVSLLETVVVPAPERDPLWESLLDVVLWTTGFVGMVLFLREIDQPQLRIAWRVVAPSLVAAQTWLFARYMKARPAMVADAELEFAARHAAWIELGVGALLLPSLAINMAFAYGGT